ncbi:MAG: FecR domain-containing protein [Methylophilaceae bacterium]
MKKCLLLLVVSFILPCSISVVQAAEPLDADWTYTIKPQDTFYGIYRQYLSSQPDMTKLSVINHHQLNKILLPGQVLRIPVRLLKKIPAPVQVLVASGEVTSTLSTENKTQTLKKGDVLTEGDVLQTGKYSVAKLGFADGSIVDIQQNSKVKIDTSYQYAGKKTYVVLLKLNKGRTEISANPNHTVGNRMQIITPSAIAAVRGTQFRVAATDTSTLQETIEGKVALSAAQKEVMIAQGYGSLAENNKAPLPPIVLPNSPEISHLPAQVSAEHGQLIFNLKPQTDVVAFVAQLAKDADFTQIINEQTIKSNQLALTSLTEGQYYLRLRAQESHGLQGASAVHAFKVLAASIEKPITLALIEPADATVIPLAPTVFSWTLVPEAKQYLLQIARDINFTDVVFEQSATTNQLVIKQSFGRGQYFWRVRVVDPDKSPLQSDIRKFSR